MSVNVAAQHLATDTIGEDVEVALRAAGRPADALQLEITEQALVEAPTGAAQALARLRQGGCQMALDDFGTGYSSLSYLRQLPVDTLKVDRSFVAGAAADGDDGALLGAIVALGPSLDLHTVAEGIETAAECAAVVAAGADHAQGYLFGRAGPADEVAGR